MTKMKMACLALLILFHSHLISIPIPHSHHSASSPLSSSPSPISSLLFPLLSLLHCAPPHGRWWFCVCFLPFVCAHPVPRHIPRTLVLLLPLVAGILIYLLSHACYPPPPSVDYSFCPLGFIFGARAPRRAFPPPHLVHVPTDIARPAPLPLPFCHIPYQGTSLYCTPCCCSVIPMPATMSLCVFPVPTALPSTKTVWEDRHDLGACCMPG